MVRKLSFVQTQNRRNSNTKSHFHYREVKYLLSQAAQKVQIPSGEIPGKSELSEGTATTVSSGCKTNL